jgi:hypothetical protein
MPIDGARERITQAVLSWEGVTAHPHRFGGTEYRLHLSTNNLVLLRSVYV